MVSDNGQSNNNNVAPVDEHSEDNFKLELFFGEDFLREESAKISLPHGILSTEASQISQENSTPFC